jgi:type IV fimbrial biogenesis protein FimT
MARPRTSGFTLIELMVALAIGALLLMLALPGYTLWIADGQIRNAAESIVGGLRYAQGEAIKRNSLVEFEIDPTTGTGGWIVRLVSDKSMLQRGRFSEGADKTSFVTIDTALAVGTATFVTFTGLGFIDAVNYDVNSVPNASPVLAQVQVAPSVALAGTRNLNVLVGGTRTGIKICDPAWPSTDPKGCPALGG